MTNVKDLKKRFSFVIFLLLMLCFLSFLLNFSNETGKAADRAGFSHLWYSLWYISNFNFLHPRAGIFWIFVLILISIYFTLNETKEKALFYKLAVASVFIEIFTIYFMSYLSGNKGIGLYVILFSSIIITIVSLFAIFRVPVNEEDEKENKKLISEEKENKTNEGSSKIEIINLIKKLEELKNSGILTEEEFEEKKKKLLEKI